MRSLRGTSPGWIGVGQMAKFRISTGKGQRYVADERRTFQSPLFEWVVLTPLAERLFPNKQVVI